MSKNEKKLVKGLYYKRPQQNAPDFVKGKISIRVNDFLEFVEQNEDAINSKNYMSFDMLKSKGGNIYFTLDDLSWMKDKPVNKPKPESVNEDIPF